MNPLEIYYFSGSGNSLAVAKDLAGELEAQLTPVVSAMRQERVHTEADTVGFVFPIYDFKPPRVVQNLVCKLDDIGSKYLFAVCTYGIAASHSLRHLDEAIRACGGHLSAGFAVRMPHNGIGSRAMAPARDALMFAAWKGRLKEVCGCIEARAEARIESSPPLLNFLQPGIIGTVPVLFRFVKQALFRGMRSMVLTANDHCDGCGVCARVCPMSNIEIAGNKPLWSDHCAVCFACLHWCPREAISMGGVDMSIRVRHHPEVKLKEMLRRER